MILRNYQQDVDRQVIEAWRAGARNVMMQLTTGGGKTPLIAHRVTQAEGPAVAIAHRQELVGNLSLALARWGVRHSVMAPQKVRRGIVSLHMAETGRNYLDPNSPHVVASVDTLNKQADQIESWRHRVALQIHDEGHHVLRENKWGRAADLFPNALGLFPTATPGRADGAGLGRHADGLSDELILGPDAGWLIANGYLCDYRVVAPPSDFQRPGADAVGSTGDIKHKANVAAVKASRIIGDVAEQYGRHAPGARGIVFTVDVETANQEAAAMAAAGIRAEAVSAKTPDAVRAQLMDRLRRHDLDVLVNCDLFGEGVDVPALDAVVMARATESLAVHLQQIGRGLRPLYADGYDLSTADGRLAAIAASAKPRARILDHVGNVHRHGLPDTPRQWTLDRREKRSKAAPDGPPVRTCVNEECLAVYERIHTACPFCGVAPQPAERSAPEQVDGDLVELDPQALAKLRGEAARVDGAAKLPQGMSGAAAGGAQKKHRERQEAQAALRDAMARWGGARRAVGDGDREAYRRFYHRFGVDVLSAQALGRPEAEQLTERIEEDLRQ